MGDTKFRQTGRRTRQGPYRADAIAQRRAEGEERNAAWQALSTKDKLHVLARRPGNSTRQVRKLGKELTNAAS